MRKRLIKLSPFKLTLYAVYLKQIYKHNWLYQMPSHTDSLHTYKQIIHELEKPFLQNVTDDALFKEFKLKLSTRFKLDITFDSDLSEALREYYKLINESFMGTDGFINKLRFIQKLNNVFYDRKFISRRDCCRLRQILKREIESPINSWLEQLAYLKNAEDLQQFRADFLLRYMHVPDEDIDNLIQDEREMKKYYQKFFRDCLDDNIKPRVINFIEDIFSQQENKSVMLSDAIIKELEKKLGAEVGGSEKEILLNAALVDLAQRSAYQNDQQIQQRLQNQLKQLERALQKFSGLNIIKEKKLELSLGKFGSLASGFASIDADLDLTILTNSYVNQIQVLKLLHEFLKREYKEDSRRNGRRVQVEIITSAKTPLISVKILQPSEVAIHVDIIVNNILGVINSQFLKVYSSVRWVKNLGLLVKMWGKASGLIKKSMLSSYAMVLMLIHYLIHKNQVNALMDAREKDKSKPHFHFKRMKAGDTEQFDVYYNYKATAKDVTNCERVNYTKILMGFMKYYAEDIWKLKEEQRIITVDQSKERPVDPECCITIKDPFDKPHNPGRLRLDSKDFFIQKFKDAFQILRSGKEERVVQLFKA